MIFSTVTEYWHVSIWVGYHGTYFPICGTLFSQENFSNRFCQNGCMKIFSWKQFLFQQKPIRRSLAYCLKKNFHWKCFSLTFIVLLCLASIAFCQIRYQSYINVRKLMIRFEHMNSLKGPCQQGYNFIPVAFVVMLYIVYIMECWHYKNGMDSVPKADMNLLEDYLAQVKAADPIVWWRALCYHYVRKSRQIIRNRNGDPPVNSQVYYERVNTHSSGAVFLYEEVGVKDISKRLLHLRKYPVLRFRFAKGFVFANHQSANEFEDQRARFFQENEQRDDYMEVKEGMELANILLKDKLIVFGSGSRAPWFLNSWFFWFSSIFLLSWPLRILTAYKTAYVNYHVTKLFGTNYLSPTNQNYTGPLARVPTVDSQDLEAIVAAGSFLMVPTYSEALLMNDEMMANNLTNGTLQNRSFAQDNQGNLHIRTRSSTETLNNEGVLTNYGAFEARWWPNAPGTNLLKSSTSLSLKRLTAILQQYNKKHLQHMILNKNRRNRRSTSFGGISPTLSHWPFSPPPRDTRLTGKNCNAYASVPPTPNDDDASHVDSAATVTPPPTYDAALTMKPAAVRLGRSATNVSASYDGWFKWLNNNLAHLVRHHQVTPTTNNGAETSIGGRLARFDNGEEDLTL